MKFIEDKEVDLTKGDLLHTKSYADTIQSIINQTADNSHLTIGLFGEWGSGKSSIISTVGSSLEKDDSNVKFILYDAWKYSNDSFRRMFLLRIQESLKFKKKGPFINFYSSTSKDLEITRKPDWHIVLIGGFMFVILVVALLFTVNRNTQSDSTLSLALLVSVFSLLMAWIGKVFNDFKYSVQEPVIVAAEKFEDCFDAMVQKSLHPTGGNASEWVENNGHVRGLKKIVIVIDNIDRCSEAIAYELITSIKNFLGNKKNVHFLIPVDQAALKRHIEKNASADSREADEFLRKFFDVTIRINHFRVHDLRDFTESVNEKHELQFNPDTIDIISNDFLSNPRRVIQLMNNLSAELEIFSTRYDKGFSKRYESLICKALILREEWPIYYKAISKQPFLLIEPNEAINKEVADSSGLFAFLNTTASIHYNVELEIIESIFGTHDRNTKVSVEINKAIKEKDVTMLKAQVIDNHISQDTLVTFLFEQIEKAIQQKSFKTRVNNLFDLLCHINSWSSFSLPQHRKFYQVIQHDFNAFILYVDYQIASNYIVSSTSYSPGLSNMTLTLIEGYVFNIESDGEADFPPAKKLLEAFIEAVDDPYFLQKMKRVFNITYRRVKELDKLEINASKLRSMTDSGFIKVVFENADRIQQTQDWVKMKDFIFLAKQVQFSPAELEQILAKINEYVPEFAGLPEGFVAKAIEAAGKILEFQDPKSGDNEWPELEKFIYKGIHSDSLDGVEKDNFYFKSPEAAQIDYADLVLFAYKVSNEKWISVPVIRALMNDVSDTGNVFRMELFNLMEKHDFSLENLRDIIWSVDVNSNTYFPFVEHYIYQFTLTDPSDKSEIKRKLAKIVTYADKEEAEANEFLYHLAEKPELKELLKELVCDMEIGGILAHTSFIKTLGIPKLADSDNNLSDYSLNTALLKIFMQFGDNFLKARVVQLLIPKFSDPTQVSMALDILENARQLGEDQAELLLEAISNISDVDLMEEGFLILKNKFQGFRNDSSVVLNIIFAEYESRKNGNRYVVTRNLRAAANSGRLEIEANNLIMGDPHFGDIKYLTIEYSYQDQLITREWREGESVQLP